MANNDINVLALVKGGERYVFLFDDDHKGDVMRVFGRFASDVDLSFSWYDAAVLSQKIIAGNPKPFQPKTTNRIDKR